MKTLILTTAIVLATFLSVAQVNLFGIDLLKYTEVKSDLVYQRVECEKNSFYTFAEYKSFPAKNIKFVIYDDFMGENATTQMLNAKEYTKELSTEISKTLGRCFKIYDNKTMTKPIENQYFWIVKQGEKYLVAKLFYNQFSQRNNLRVFIFDSAIELTRGFETLTKVENKNENVYFDMAMVDQNTK